MAVAPELREWESGQQYPFLSGISADGCPLEVSISLSHKSVSAARFIVQPFRFDRDCVGIFKHRWAALKSSLNFSCHGEPIDGVLQALERHEVDDRRSCVCWLGAENTIEQRLSAKIYIY
ncbi:hypothetical protein AB4Z51_43920, partial [Bradyrhizobium sp. 2TAF36]|uniref:hypothetical protein n=1 Tax=Bradyrhizobium sp. 2TAF36 TaxID=3233016 RepID=UPI003F8E7C03